MTPRTTPASGNHPPADRPEAPRLAPRGLGRAAALSIGWVVLVVYPVLRAAEPTPASAPPAAAPVRPVTDDYFGTKVIDPYRWMEEPGSTEFAAWLKTQAAHADAVLGALPGRAELRARVRALDDATTTVSAVQAAGGRLFYLRAAPGEDSPKLCVREGDGAPNGPTHPADRVLLDPARLGAKGDTHAAIDYFVPSPDGTRVAVGLSTGGSERSVLRVLDATDGRDLGEEIDRAANAEPCWRPDGRAFFYRRLAQVAADAPPSERYKNRRAYQHLLGTDPAQDTPLLAHGLTPGVDVGEDDKPLVFASPASPHALARVTHGISRELALYSAPLGQLDGAHTPWRKVADASDEITQADLHGDELFLLSHHGAARYQVLRVRLPAGDLRAATTVVAASEVVLTQIRCAADALYVCTLDGGLGGVLRVPYGESEEPKAGGERRDAPVGPSPAVASAAPPPSVALPFAGAIWEFSADPLAPGVVFSLEGWVRSPVLLRYDPAAGAKVADTGLQPPSPVDCRDIESFEVKARAADGTLVPLSIVARRGLARDGSAPALLTGYGGYGISINPFFDPTRLAWLERGGVWAVAHVRGGGEYGEDWHLGGQKLTKPNSWGDFIACAEYLVAQKWTAPEHLAAMGGSAGGITVGRAMTSRPDLFGAVVIQAGVCNALRFETAPAGPPNVPEMGTATEPAGFRGLYEMDAVHHVKDGTAYPAVLLTAGINDPRVEPWQSAKMAARLQAATTGGKPVLLRVDYDAGHGQGSSRAQGQAEQADVATFLLWQLGGRQEQASEPGR